MYKITLGQLMPIWAFVLFNIMICLGSGDSLGNYNVSGFYEYFVLLILFTLIFYTIGWRNNRKNNRPENKNLEN
jgi:membrane protein DedA with SNARE-associated domain